MLLLISPAKTLDYDTPVPPAVLAQATEPLFSDQAALLIAALRKKSPRQIGELMGLSDKLVALNAARYAAWVPQATADNSKPAVLAFDGDVYDGLQAPTLSAADLRWTQDHVVILSGLYGALRPLDWLQPYRLEMGTALKTRRGKDLYAFWGDRVAKHLNEQQAGQAEPVIVNLASIEYARVARRSALRFRGRRRRWQLQDHQLLRQEGARDDGASCHRAPRDAARAVGRLLRRGLRAGARGVDGRPAGVPPPGPRCLTA